jgi:hypothetical protein
MRAGRREHATDIEPDRTSAHDADHRRGFDGRCCSCPLPLCRSFRPEPGPEIEALADVALKAPLGRIVELSFGPWLPGNSPGRKTRRAGRDRRDSPRCSLRLHQLGRRVENVLAAAAASHAPWQRAWRTCRRCRPHWIWARWRDRRRPGPAPVRLRASPENHRHPWPRWRQPAPADRHADILGRHPHQRRPRNSGSSPASNMRAR